MKLVHRKLAAAAEAVGALPDEKREAGLKLLASLEAVLRD